MFLNDSQPQRAFGLTHLAIVVALASPLYAQQTSGPGTTRSAITGGVDFVSGYMFRGARQDDRGPMVWPHAEFGLTIRSAESGVRRIIASAGAWNSVNRGWTGSEGPSGKRWYESDVYATLGLGFGDGVNVGTTYTAYVSPNKMFTTVNEISVKATVDRAALGRASLRPYGLVAFELDTKPGIGQLDGGFKPGKYLELGAAPGYSVRRIGVAVPVKVGLSLGNYYELAGRDHPFGFASIAGIVTVPLTRSARVGSWNVHGGVEYQRLGITTKAFNAGDASKTIASIGIGFSH